MKAPVKQPSILLSKRANVFYLERVRLLQKDERVVYLTQTGAEVERFFNIPARNTAFVLLGKGTSITDAAARMLAEANVVVGFCGSGGSPLFSTVDSAFLIPQSEYRPTEYMQAWMRLWLDEPKRLALAKELMLQRLVWTQFAWKRNAALAQRGLEISDALVAGVGQEVQAADSTTALLLIEARWAKLLYARLAGAFKLEFSRKERQRQSETKEDTVNSFLDHGNYLAYGYAAVVLNGLGISFSLPLLHGKTRRGALVFDIADLVKDAYVMPLAFELGAKKTRQQEFRYRLIDLCQTEEILDMLFGFVSNICKKY